MGDKGHIKGDEVTALAVVADGPPTVAAVSESGTLGSGPRQVVAQRYEVLGLLGVGGMGSVYRARDIELDELVALKVLKRDLIDTPGCSSGSARRCASRAA